MSQTIWAGQSGPPRDPLEAIATGVSVGVGAGAVAGAAGLARASSRRDEVAVAEPLVDVRDVPWELPPVALLEIRAAAIGGGQMDHEENKADIEEKLRSFGIAAKVVAVNSGPVVTQYEVRPDAPREDLADRGASPTTSRWRSSARSIRIEAPIPGKDIVGIEIPNEKSEDGRLPAARRRHPDARRRRAG